MYDRDGALCWLRCQPRPPPAPRPTVLANRWRCGVPRTTEFCLCDLAACWRCGSNAASRRLRCGSPSPPRSQAAAERSWGGQRTARRFPPTTTWPVGNSVATLRPVDGATAKYPRHLTTQPCRAVVGLSTDGVTWRLPSGVIATCRWCGGDAASLRRRDCSPRMHALPGGGNRETGAQRTSSSYQGMAFALSPW